MDISSEVEHSGSSGEKKKRRQPGKEQTPPIYQEANWLTDVFIFLSIGDHTPALDILIPFNVYLVLELTHPLNKKRTNPINSTKVIAYI